MSKKLPKENLYIAKLLNDDKKLTYQEVANKVNEEFGIELTGENIRDRYRRVAGLQGMTCAEFRKSKIESFLESQGMTGDNWGSAWIREEGLAVFVKNKELVQKTYEDMRDDLIVEMQKYAPKYPKIKRSKEKRKYLLKIDPADVHFGKLSTTSETGEEYNLKIAEQRFSDGVDSLLNMVQNFDVHQIVFVLGNDILHIDNARRTTTSGTPQDTDGMWQDSFQIAKKCYIKAIEKCLQVADVHLVFCPSNHDFVTGYMLADSVNSWFHNSSNVSNQITMAHRQYIKYGNSLIGLTHGDGAKLKDLGLIMAKEASQAWSETKYRYWVQHHVHHKHRIMIDVKDRSQKDVEKDRIGYTEIQTGLKTDPTNQIHVEYVRSPSAPDRWHSTNGYLNQQSIEAFLYHEEHGQVARLTHNF